MSSLKFVLFFPVLCLGYGVEFECIVPNHCLFKYLAFSICREKFILPTSGNEENIATVARFSTTKSIFRDYHMGFWLSPEVLTRDSNISPRALARGLILKAMPKTSCYNLFITYSNPQFELFS